MTKEQLKNEAMKLAIKIEENKAFLGSIAIANAFNELVDAFWPIEAGVKVKKVITENPDSITLGAPTQGQIKVYGDSAKPDEFKARLKAAMELLGQARSGVL